MDPKDLRLFDLLRIDEAQGTISLHGQRMIVVNAGDLGLLRKELITTFGTDRARGILVRFGYARGYRDALATKEMFGWKSVDDWLSAGARLYTIEGSGAIEIVDLRVDQERKSYQGSATLQNSFEANQHLDLFGVGAEPVCWILTGYASGYSSAVMGARVFFTENSCRGKGDRQCHIIGQSMDLMSDQTRRAIEEFQGADFDLEMRTALASLDERTKDLEIERAHTESLQRQVVQLEQLLTLENDTDAMVAVSDGFERMMDEDVLECATELIVMRVGETGAGQDLRDEEIVSNNSAKVRQPANSRQGFNKRT